MTYISPTPIAPATIPSPPLALAALEPYRAMAELAGLWLAAPMLWTAPRGDGHCVLVLPGFNTDGLSTHWLRRYIAYLGYQSTDWSLGRNLGYRTLGASEERLRRQVRALADSSGGKISLVGWSLGGVMARHMARDHPDCVRQVVTLAAPFTGDPTASTIRSLYEMLSGEDLDASPSRRAWQANRAAPSVPTTSIYSKSDGITAWQNCVEIETERAENIEVVGSHLGLTHNAMALYALADRLAQPENGWRPYAGRRA
jgi:pimeloyl-ACP methyl ester carboxylesterase